MKRKNIDVFLIGKYPCIIRQIQPDVESSKRYHVTVMNFFGNIVGDLTKTCLNLGELINFLKKVKCA